MKTYFKFVLLLFIFDAIPVCNSNFYYYLDFKPCNSSEKLFSTIDKCEKSHCVDGHCTCERHTDGVVYFTNGDAQCVLLAIDDDEIKTCHAEEVLVALNNNCFEQTIRGLDSCDNLTCYEFQERNAFESCGFNDSQSVMFVCDKTEMMKCSYGRCLCFDGYKYNFKNMTCEKPSSDRKSFIDEYCTVKSHCEEGLVCNATNYTCQCPSPCTYRIKRGVCDCGLLDLNPGIGVIITGAVLGILSTIFWCCLNYHTLNPPKRPVSISSNRDDEIQSTRMFEPSSTPIPVPPTVIDNPPSYNQVVPNAPIGFKNDEITGLPAYDNYTNSQPPSSVPYPINPQPSLNPNSCPESSLPYAINPNPFQKNA